MMSIEAEPTEACPRCHQTARVVRKLLLINPASSAPAASQSVCRVGCTCEGLSVDDLKPEFASMGQFVQGLYCESCAVGYIPEGLAKPPPPKYQPSPGGWRRVLTDGTLGPLLHRISDDPESQV
jgi:hypothetical protein